MIFSVVEIRLRANATAEAFQRLYCDSPTASMPSGEDFPSPFNHIRRNWSGDTCGSKDYVTLNSEYLSATCFILVARCHMLVFVSGDILGASVLNFKIAAGMSPRFGHEDNGILK